MPPFGVNAEADLREALQAVEQYGSVTIAAAHLNIPRTTLGARLQRARLWQQQSVVPPTPKPFTVDPLPSETPTADELLSRRKTQFARKTVAKEARKLINVSVAIDGPFGIMHMGDPHVDDDGTDIAKLESHVALCNQTEGLFAANVGDYSNNWVGRLARLYGEQSTSAAEAWVLVEWLITSAHWLYLIGGNHDLWSGSGDPLKWMSRQANSLYEHHGARLGIVTPTGRVFRVNARHDFSGHSQWNTAHGPSKAVQMGWRDHVLTCGHTHVSGYQVLRDPSTGLISHALRVGTYKVYDRYAEEKGLPNQNIFVAPVTIFDDRFADDDVRAVTVLFDPGEAAEYLTWKRQKWAKGSLAT
jgi:hypothetical protein